MANIYDFAFEIGDIVYLTTDKEQLPRVVLGILILPEGIKYLLSMGTTDSYHWKLELSLEKNVLTQIN